MKLSDIESFYINLDSRPDRNEHAVAEFNKVGISATRIPACGPEDNKFMKPGEWGCMKSHELALHHGIMSNKPVIAIYEDDVWFPPGAAENFEAWYEEVPSDWGMIYLGANKLQTVVEQTSSHTQRVVNAFSAHAIIMKRKTAITLKTKALPGFQPLDVIYGNYQVMIPTYTFTPSLAGQRAGWSDIMEESVDYNWIYGL